MILYNGASGVLGRHLSVTLRDSQVPAYALQARLEDRVGLAAELQRLDPGNQLTFIHLAARVSVPLCESDPSGAYRVNVQGARDTVVDILDWASRLGVDAEVIYVSSGHVYAATKEPEPVTEDAPVLPRSVYAQTKLQAERVIHALTSDRGIPLVVARVFGLIAPDQSGNYVLPALIQRVRGHRTAQVPGLDNVRDYLDARDVCEDLLHLAERSDPFVPHIVNVCSGAPVPVRHLLWAVAREVDPEGADRIARTAQPAPGRPDDIPWLVGDPGRFIALTGVHPQRRPLAQTVADAVRASTAAASDLASEGHGPEKAAR